jgi:nucleotide-binding universal stress UspA family protein
LSFPYKKILCAIDFDDHCVEAINQAAALAQHFSAVLYLLHVIQINPLAAQGAAEGLAGKEFYDSQVKAARQHLEQLVQSIPAAVKREIVIEIGEPAGSISAAQQRLGADLHVMATHGRRGFKRLVLGSVAEKVLRESVVPVLTVR